MQIIERDEDTTYKGPWLRVNSRVKLSDEIFTHLWLPISRQHYDIASELVQDDRPSEDRGSYFDVELDAVMSLAHQNGQILEGSSVTIYLTDDRLSVASNEFEDLLVLTDRSITSAYFEEGYLFIMTDKSELCLDLQGLNVSMEQWLFNHPLIRRMTRDMKSSPDLIAKVLKDNKFIGVYYVALADETLLLRSHHSHHKIPVMQIETLDVIDQQAVINAKGEVITLVSSTVEIRDLVDEIWLVNRSLPAKILKADFIHPSELVETLTVNEILNQMPFEEVKTYREEIVDKSALPDMIGKAVMSTKRQLPRPFEIINEVSAILGISPPPCYVYDSWQCVVDVVSFTSPRIELSSRCLSEFTDVELKFHLARNCAHIALDHMKTEVLGEEMLRILQLQGEIKSTGVSKVGSVIGGGIGTLGGPIGTAIGATAGGYIAQRLASDQGIQNPEGDLMLEKIKLFKWFRTAVLSTDAFGYLYCNQVEGAVSAILMSVFNNRELVNSIYLPDFIKQAEEIEAISGNAAMYSRLDEVLPYAPSRLGELLSYAVSDHGLKAIRRMSMILRDTEVK